MKKKEKINKFIDAFLEEHLLFGHAVAKKQLLFFLSSQKQELLREMEEMIEEFRLPGAKCNNDRCDTCKYNQALTDLLTKIKEIK